MGLEKHCMHLCTKVCILEKCMCIITHESLSGYVPDQVIQENLENSFRDLSLIEEKSSILDDSAPITAQEIVLKKCGQVQPIPFTKCYPER